MYLPSKLLKTLLLIPLVKTRKYSKYLENLLIKMPREPKHIVEAQKQRNKIKERLQKYVPGKVMLQVLGTGAEGAPRSLYMFTDQSRYLFNCGEGTQRLAHEHKMKLSKLEHIFITQPIWRNIGGLPGTALTIQDVGVPQITLHGPPGLDELFMATKRFVVIKDMKISVADCSPEEQFQDNVMTVDYVPIYKSENTSSNEMITEETEKREGENDKGIQVGSTTTTGESSTSTRSERKRSRSRSRRRNKSRSSSSSSNSSAFEEDTTDYYAHEQSGKRNLQDQMQNVTIPHRTRTQNMAMCYICRLAPRAGALCLDLCVKAGVPPGPLLGKLKSGEDVVLQSGTTVRSKDVCEPDDPGPVFLIVDCPSEEYLESLGNNEVWANYQATADCDEDLAYVVVHFTPAKVLEHPLYQAWVDKFSPSTQHLILNEKNTCMGSQAVHRIQHKLNLLHKNLFPLLADCGTPLTSFKNPDGNLLPANKRMKVDNGSPSENSSSDTSKLIENLSVTTPISSNSPYLNAGTFCSFHLRPRLGLDRSGEICLSPDTYLEECYKLEDFPAVLASLQSELKDKLATDDNSISYPQVIFLGTGSCIPNKTRNTSGILFRINESTNILLDCGEGTYGQIIRFYGYSKALDILTNMKAIYISHLHADHHIGLIGVLEGRKRAFAHKKLTCTPLHLFAPEQIMTWLNMYDRRLDRIAENFQLFANGELMLNKPNSVDAKRRERVFESLDLSQIDTCLVRHCPNAFGVAFTIKCGFKLTYSGDTMPSDPLVQLGSNSDLLIHEATMEDELAHEAVAKMHSTTSQAISIGRRMNAKQILLTHFSQRYAKLPRFNDNFTDNVGIAFDNMAVSFKEISHLPLLYPALKIMFADEYVELEHKAAKRLLRQERKLREKSN